MEEKRFHSQKGNASHDVRASDPDPELLQDIPVPRQKQKRVAVNDLSLEVPAGGLFGFLGPNGAGKTTTIKMLLGFIPPTAGGAWLFGVPSPTITPAAAWATCRSSLTSPSSCRPRRSSAPTPAWPA